MKTLIWSCFVLVLITGQLHADENLTDNNKIMLTLDSGQEVHIKGFIAPVEYTQDNFHVTWDTLANLRVAEPEKQHPETVFRAFLPNQAVSIGELWQIKEEGVLTLLRQLHPNPHLDMHINMGDSRGLWACLRAYNDRFADIMFRIHAEFKLKDGWFTPSQFAGHLVIDRIGKRVAFFEMRVPEALINFDVNKQHEGAQSFGTDMGYCPQIELRGGTQDILQNAKFTEAITLEEAERLLKLRFYKSQQINWVSIDEALKMAPAHQKPVHAISINGPLDDEAC